MVKSSSCPEVCDSCITNVLSTQRRWGWHHRDLAHLKKSAQSKCMFCTSILNEIVSKIPDLDNLPWPCYRWSIHALASTRDVDEILSVVFTPVHTYSEEMRYHIETDLREKTFYLYHEKVAGHMPKEQKLGFSTDSAQSWNQVRKWINTCLTEHPKCQRKTQDLPPLPTRLLDIRDVTVGEDLSGSIKLVNTKRSKIHDRYTTLSHSWGPNPTFIAIKAEDEAQMMETGITLNDSRLSNNFRQAIQVSRQLGINYMWMDSLCILQQNAEDFSKEAPLMHLYYRNSFCNITAADARLPDDGLFRDRDFEEYCSISVPAKFSSSTKASPFGCKTWMIVPADFWEEMLLQEPLYKRGWVFQERMLAPRLLHFARDQIFFECATISACETMPDKLPRAIDERAATDRHWRQRLQSSLALRSHQLSGTEDLSVEAFWKTAVSTYTRCNLTDGKDKLVAVSGVATLVKEALNETYGYGLWAASLEEQLAWRVVDCKQADSANSHRPWPPRCPSWSWASMDAIIDIQDRLVPDREYRVRSHHGEPIKFVVDEGSGNDKISVPDVLLGAKKTDDTQNQEQIHTSVATSIHATPSRMLHSLSMSTVHPACIEMQVYLRNGWISFNDIHNQWLLQTIDKASVGENSKDIRIEVFPDEVPATNLCSCTYMVLGYSRVKSTLADDFEIIENYDEVVQDENDGGKNVVIPRIRHWSSYSGTAPPPTFKGLGLIVVEVITDHYVRQGSFHFNDLSAAQLQALIPIATEVDTNDQVRNIFLH